MKIELQIKDQHTLPIAKNMDKISVREIKQLVHEQYGIEPEVMIVYPTNFQWLHSLSGLKDSMMINGMDVMVTVMEVDVKEYTFFMNLTTNVCIGLMVQSHDTNERIVTLLQDLKKYGLEFDTSIWLQRKMEIPFYFICREDQDLYLRNPMEISEKNIPKIFECIKKHAGEIIIQPQYVIGNTIEEYKAQNKLEEEIDIIMITENGERRKIEEMTDKECFQRAMMGGKIIIEKMKIKIRDRNEKGMLYEMEYKQTTMVRDVQDWILEKMKHDERLQKTKLPKHLYGRVIWMDKNGKEQPLKDMMRVMEVERGILPYYEKRQSYEVVYKNELRTVYEYQTNTIEELIQTMKKMRRHEKEEEELMVIYGNRILKNEERLRNIRSMLYIIPKKETVIEIKVNGKSIKVMKTTTIGEIKKLIKGRMWKWCDVWNVRKEDRKEDEMKEDEMVGENQEILLKEKKQYAVRYIQDNGKGILKRNVYYEKEQTVDKFIEMCKKMMGITGEMILVDKNGIEIQELNGEDEEDTHVKLIPVIRVIREEATNRVKDELEKLVEKVEKVEDRKEEGKGTKRNGGKRKEGKKTKKMRV